MEIPLQTSGRGFGAWIQAAEHQPTAAGQAWALWAPLPAAGPSGLFAGPACCSLEARNGAPSASPSVQAGQCPFWGCGAQEVQALDKIDTHSFNCTYTKEGEAVGLLGRGPAGLLLPTVVGPQVMPTCAHPGLRSWAQDRLCKASELNKLTVLQGQGPALPCPWGGGGGAGGER